MQMCYRSFRAFFVGSPFCTEQTPSAVHNAVSNMAEPCLSSVGQTHQNFVCSKSLCFQRNFGAKPWQTAVVLAAVVEPFKFFIFLVSHFYRQAVDWWQKLWHRSTFPKLHLTVPISWDSQLIGTSKYSWYFHWISVWWLHSRFASSNHSLRGNCNVDTA